MYARTELHHVCSLLAQAETYTCAHKPDTSGLNNEYKAMLGKANANLSSFYRWFFFFGHIGNGIATEAALIKAILSCAVEGPIHRLYSDNEISQMQSIDF